MSFLNDFGHFGGPEWEWEGGPPPPICPACGQRHEMTDPCPPPSDEEEWPLPEEPPWCSGDTPDMPVEFLGEVHLEYDPMAFTYKHVMFRSPN
jgi:hypothetical protein